MTEMKSRSGQWVIAGTAAIVAVFGWLLYGGLDKNVVFFLTPKELLAKGTEGYDVPVRLGGQVKPGSVKWDDKTLRSPVRGHRRQERSRGALAGAPPQMFRDGMGVVSRGASAVTRVFDSTSLMVKHSNEYRAPKPGEKPQEMYKSLIKGVRLVNGLIGTRALLVSVAVIAARASSRAGRGARGAPRTGCRRRVLRGLHELLARDDRDGRDGRRARDARLLGLVRRAGRKPRDAALLHGDLALGRARGVDPLLGDGCSRCTPPRWCGSNSRRPGNLVPYAGDDAARRVAVLRDPARRDRPNPFDVVSPVPADGPGAESAAAESHPDGDASAAAVSRLRRDDRAVRVRRRRDALRRGRRERLDAASRAAGRCSSWALPLGGDHRRHVVVVRSARVGRLLGVGSRRERVVHAVAHGDRVPALGDGAGAARRCCACGT